MNAVSSRLSTQAQPVRFTASDFETVVRSGALNHLGHTELRDGVIVEIVPQFGARSYAKAELSYALRRSLDAAVSPLRIYTEVSLLHDDTNMPAPDITVFEPYAGDGPIPLAAVRLLIEISVSTLADDLGSKRTLYAGAGVPEYWVVDVAGRAVHQFADPDTRKAEYGFVQVSPFGKSIEARSLAGLVLHGSVLS